MGGRNSKRKILYTQYFQIVNSRKKAYYNSNKQYIEYGNFKVTPIQNWKSIIISDFEGATLKFPSSKWPLTIIELCKTWKSIKDRNWGQKVQWFDYLKQYNLAISSSQSLHRKSWQAKTLQSFLKSHLKTPKQNFIAALINTFRNQITKSCLDLNSSESCLKFSDKLLNQPQKQSVELIEQIKAFILLVLQSMTVYYGGLFAKYLKQQPGEMYDLILGVVMTKELHQVLLNLFSLAQAEDESLYQIQIQKYSQIKCSDIGIEEVFQLDQNCENAYQKGVESLKLICKEFDPSKKIKVIVNTTRMICECVDQYWEGQDVDKKRLVIDSDQIFNIFMYIVVKAGIENLMAQLKIISQFSRFQVKNSSQGYYVTTLEASIEQILKFSPEVMRRLSLSN